MHITSTIEWSVSVLTMSMLRYGCFLIISLLSLWSVHTEDGNFTPNPLCPDIEKMGATECADTCVSDKNCSNMMFCCYGNCKKAEALGDEESNRYKTCIYIDMCKANPCKNNGTCITQMFNEYKCNCSKGFFGENCTQEINACESAPCQNGGTCGKIRGGEYFCCCQPGFAGKDCELHDPCRSSNCSKCAANLNAKCVWKVHYVVFDDNGEEMEDVTDKCQSP